MGIISLIKSDSEAIGETFNIGSDIGVNIEELVYLIGDLIGTTPKISCDHKRIRPKDSEVDRLICNNEKIKSSPDVLLNMSGSGWLTKIIIMNPATT